MRTLHRKGPAEAMVTTCVFCYWKPTTSRQTILLKTSNNLTLTCTFQCKGGYQRAAGGATCKQCMRVVFLARRSMLRLSYPGQSSSQFPCLLPCPLLHVHERVPVDVYPRTLDVFVLGQLGVAAASLLQHNKGTVNCKLVCLLLPLASSCMQSEFSGILKIRSMVGRAATPAPAVSGLYQ